jgi:phosphopantetheinyl transferase (holo-ACP synthase)
MEQSPEYIKHVDLIRKEEFIHLFNTSENPESWFSKKELEVFSFPKNVRSLAARYLIKKRICGHLGVPDLRRQIEILNDPYGKPEIILGENIRMVMKEAGIKRILCSISHSRNYITGMTIFCF